MDGIWLVSSLEAVCAGHHTWVLAVFCAVLVGFSGVLPLFILPLETGARLKQRDGEKRLRLLLSFAVGGLMGDVFLHLLPEALRRTRDEQDQVCVGLWVIGGVMFFTMLEVIFTNTSEQCHDSMTSSAAVTNNSPLTNGRKLTEVNDLQLRQRNSSATLVAENRTTSSEKQINGLHTKTDCANRKLVSGYLNLLANSVDNFTHGLAIGGSFLASTRIGLLTTFAILIHEIPHEVGDFAILIKSGFGRWEAARAQLATASLGVLGAVCALLVDDSDDLGLQTAWILPFTAGGFIQIALVGVLPEVVKECEPLQCIKQGCCLMTGVIIMLLVTMVTHH